MTNAWKAGAGAILIALPVLSQTAIPVREEGILSFIHETYQYEIAASRLAMKSSASSAVKNFAQQMVDDQAAADTQVRTYTSGHGIELDSLSTQLDRLSKERIEQERRSRTVGSATGEWAWTWEHTLLQEDRRDDEELAKLRSLSGAAFDREYVHAMIDGQQKAIDRFTDAATEDISSDLRKLIHRAIPGIQNHLEMAQAVQAADAKE
jgi:predicted outer membrane protein